MFYICYLINYKFYVGGLRNGGKDGIIIYRGVWEMELDFES